MQQWWSRSLGGKISLYLQFREHFGPVLFLKIKIVTEQLLILLGFRIFHGATHSYKNQLRTPERKKKSQPRTLREVMRAGKELLKEEMLAKMETKQERLDAKLGAHYERMMARMESQLEQMEAALDVFKERLNKMDTTNLEAN
jgi:hypothetical protein